MKLRPLLPCRRCVLHQRESKYDRLSSCLVDFKSRAVCASVKNFQIVQSEPEDPKQRPRCSTRGRRRGVSRMKLRPAPLSLSSLALSLSLFRFYAADGEGAALFDAHVGRVRAGEDARFKRPANRRG